MDYASDRSLNCISFVAVSSAPQAEEVSLDEQAEVNAGNASRLGGHIIHQLRVPGHTRRYDTLAEIAVDVPAYAELRQIIDKKSADLLLAYTPDRLARTPSLLLDIAQKCWRAGIALYINSMPPHTLDPQAQAQSLSQQFLLAFAGVQAGGEINTLMVRHRFGMAARVKRKKQLPGMAPYGYVESVVSRETTRIVPDPETAPIVRWILIDLYLGQGMGIQRIADMLNERRVITPSRRRDQIYNTANGNADKWERYMVRAILERGARYAGYIELNKTGDREYIIVKGDYEPLITEAEFALFDAERQRRDNGPHAEYEITSLCRCATCGSTMHVSQHSRQYVYVLCRACSIRVRYHVVIDALAAAFDAIDDNADLVQQRRSGQEEAERELCDLIADYDDQLARVGDAIGRLLDALEDASMPSEQIGERLRVRQADKQRLESLRLQAQRELEQVRILPDPETQIAQIRAGAALLRSGMLPAEINQKLRAMIDYVLLSADGEVSIYL